jgi:hypothetical protein
MIVAFRRPCVDHRAALVDFVDRRALGPATAAALGHLDRCRACEQELSGIALAIAGLRRLHRDVEGIEPPADAWLRLRSRIQRRGDPWRWRTTLASLTASTLLVGVIAAPISFGTSSGEDLPQPPWLTHEIQVEAEYLAAIYAGVLPPASRPEKVGGIPQNYPQEIAEVRKEVASAKPTGRPPKPI